jgi:hypothetical protein
MTGYLSLFLFECWHNVRVIWKPHLRAFNDVFIYLLHYAYTVPNNSYRFWADLLIDGRVKGIADIHKYWSKMPKLPCILTRFSWAKSHNCFIIEKLKIHSGTQHLLKFADLQSIKGVYFNKCWITEWIFNFPS